MRSISGLIALLATIAGGPGHVGNGTVRQATDGRAATIAAVATGPAPGCRLSRPVVATVGTKSKLPDDVRVELETRLGGVAEVGDDYQTDDNIVGDRRPRFRFQSAVLVGREWFVTLEHGTPDSLQTIGLELMTDARTGVRAYHMQTMHNLIGPRCVAIEAMLKGVSRP